jgi:2-C-methyl-D-erythritol 4-phosphate cytidylyltransferase
VAVSVWTIVVAAGSGARFGGLKQFEQLGSHRVVDWGIETALQATDGVVVVLPADALPLASADVRSVVGGATRSSSVRNGLAAVPEDATVILVHDGARPFASVEVFDRVIEAIRAGADGAIPGIAVVDTIKRVAADGTIIGTVDRSDLRIAQTPQAFRARALRDAHRGGDDATDDAAVVEASGGRVVVVEGDPENLKITSPVDLDWARQKVASL